MLRFDFLDFFARQESEHFQVFKDLFVARIVQVLIDLVRRSLFLVEPKRVALALAEFLSRRIHDERHREGVRGLSEHLPYEVDASGDVSPLVASRHLHDTIFLAEKVNEVVALHQHVRKFGECYSRVKPSADDVLVEHIVHVDIFSDVAQEFDESEILRPVVVVHKLRLSFQKRVHLRTDFLYVFLENFRVDDFALRARTRISDSSCRAAAKQNRMMPRLGETLRHAKRSVVPQMQAVGGGIGPPIKRKRLAVKNPFQLGFIARHILYQSAPFQIFVQTHFFLANFR